MNRSIALSIIILKRKTFDDEIYAHMRSVFHDNLTEVLTPVYVLTNAGKHTRKYITDIISLLLNKN